MSVRLTNNQVQAQQERFFTLMATADLTRIGKRVVFFMHNDNKDGLYNEYNYIRRVLALSNVKQSMIEPDTNRFYGDILLRESLDAYLQSVIG